MRISPVLAGMRTYPFLRLNEARARLIQAYLAEQRRRLADLSHTMEWITHVGHWTNSYN